MLSGNGASGGFVTPRTSGVIAGMFNKDFISDTAIGVAIMCGMLFAANPVTAFVRLGIAPSIIIAAIIGGATSILLQYITTTSNYGGFLQVKIAIKQAKDDKVETKEKIIIPLTNNAIKEIFIQTNGEWLEMARV